MRFIEFHAQPVVDSPLNSSLEGRIFLEEKENVECGRCTKPTTSADIRAVFWLFIIVGLALYQKLFLFPDETLQNRYFPTTFQFWMLGSQYLISQVDSGSMLILPIESVSFGPNSLLSIKVSLAKSGITSNFCSRRRGYNARCASGVRIRIFSPEMFSPFSCSVL